MTRGEPEEEGAGGHAERFSDLMRTIAVTSTDLWEQVACPEAITWLQLATAARSRAGLHALYWHMFYYKGPLFDSNDQRDELKALRAEAISAMHAFMNEVDERGGWQ